MKNLSVVLNVILLVAVVVLYVLYFSGNKAGGPAARASDTTRINSPIAYFYTDSVVANYEFLKTGRVTLEEKEKKLTQEYQNRATGLRNEFAAYQRTRNSLTFSQDQVMQEDLAKKQQNLQLYEQSLSQQLMTDQQKLTQDFYTRLTAFCKKYGEENSLHLIVKFDQSSDVMHGNPGLNITDAVIAGLNDAYKTEKSGGVKADSTARSN